MRFTRDEYLGWMNFERPERPMFSELFGPLIGLEEEWRAQGAAPEELDLTGFDWDYVERIGGGGHCGIFGAPSPITIEETDEYLLQRDGLGRTMQLWKSTATIALPMDFPVKSMDDWRDVKPFFTFAPERINQSAIERAKAAQKQGVLITAGIPGGFDMARELMGEENACLAYYDEPELMQDILDTISDTSFRVLEYISRELTVDQLSVHEDFAGKSGALIGPTQIREYLKPYYRRIWDMLQARGAQIFSLDSDGNLNAVLDALLDCGLTEMIPMEPAAGMDIVALRQKYGTRLKMKGGIDKHVLRGTKEDIARELEYKLQPMMRAGGIVFGLDHRIPNGTPLENYRYYVKLSREILGLPPLNRQNRGWARMAF